MGKFLPFAAANAMLAVDEDPDFFSPWFGAAYLAAFTVVLLVVGIVLVQPPGRVERAAAAPTRRIGA